MKLKAKWKAFAFNHFFCHDECDRLASELYDELMEDPKQFLEANGDVVAWAPFENRDPEELAWDVEILAEGAQCVEGLE